MENKSIFLSIVIPAYNEEKRISGSLRRIFDYLGGKGYPSEVLIIDDGSTDRTKEVSQGFISQGPAGIRVISLGKNSGKGKAVRKGVSESKGEYILVTDADLSTPIEEWDKFLAEHKNGFDVVIGSRGIDPSLIATRQPWLRRITGKAFNILVRLLVMRGFNDTQCGFKSFSRAAASAVFNRAIINDFSYDVEAIFIAHAMGLKIKDVAVTWNDDARSKVRMHKDPFKMFLSLLAIRINGLRGLYGE